MTERELTRTQVGALAGCSESMVVRILKGERTPGARIAIAIERMTEGRIPVVAWYEAA